MSPYLLPLVTEQLLSLTEVVDDWLKKKKKESGCHSVATSKRQYFKVRRYLKMSRKGVNNADQTSRSGGGYHIGNAPKVKTSKSYKTITKKLRLCMCMSVCAFIIKYHNSKNIFAERVLTKDV